MVILNISKLNNNKFSGVNINIPKFTKYLNNICECGYLDLGNESLKAFENFDNYFRANDYKKFSIKLLPKPFNNPDLIVFQGLYVTEFMHIYKEVSKLNIPYTIIPRCNMTLAGQQNKPIKKKLGNFLFFNKFVKNASFIHFLTENEYLESKDCFKFKDYVIIGNGMETPLNKYKPKNRKDFIISYVGRYNIYHKGLDILLEAVKDNKEWFTSNSIRVEMHGSNSDGGYNELIKLTQENKLDKVIHIGGPIFDQEKEKFLLDSDAFIHTSRLEGHPTSVIEAISYGIPVIITPGTNMAKEVKKYKLGYVAEQSSKSVFDCIKMAFNEKKNFVDISKNEIEYANKNFDWSNISKKVLAEYLKVLNYGEKDE